MTPLVWVVDDSALDLRQAASALANDFHVRTFTDGAAVLEHLASHSPPDVVVLDWVMPGIQGIDVVRFMRTGATSMVSVPVLLLTARQQPEQIVEGLDAGANDYLAKPYSPEELRARVAALVRTAALIERARKAEETVRHLLASAPDAFVAVDAQGRLSYANQEAERAFGEPAASLLGRSIDELLPGLGLRNISIAPGMSLLPLADVTLRDRVYSPSVRVLPTDTAGHTTVALRDVTERRQMEARRTDFYSVMAHDRRSPLTSMLLRLELILQGRRGPLPADVVAEMRKFGASIRAMMKMIKDFLDLAAMEGAGYKIDRDPIDLGSLVSGVVDEVRPLAEANRLALEWTPPLGRIELLGDRHRLSQVVSNLVGNAIKFTPAEGRVELRVRTGETAYEVSVTDTGPGIPQDAVPTLFDRFTRGPEMARRGQGWGLGLMIVRDIIEAHGGRVGVRSEVGVGSSFWFTLPRPHGVGGQRHAEPPAASP